MSHFNDVKEFHQKFGLIWADTPGHLTTRKLVERIEFMSEELDEFIDAAHKQDLAQQADALVDLVYVALGTAVQLGLPWQALWDDVQAANMRKIRGMTKRGHQVDVSKPPGWVGPQTEQILRDAGYLPEVHSLEENYRDDFC